MSILFSDVKVVIWIHNSFQALEIGHRKLYKSRYCTLLLSYKPCRIQGAAAQHSPNLILLAEAFSSPADKRPRSVLHKKAIQNLQSGRPTSLDQSMLKLEH